jgi:hypothetical protein
MIENHVIVGSATRSDLRKVLARARIQPRPKNGSNSIRERSCARAGAHEAHRAGSTIDRRGVGALRFQNPPLAGRRGKIGRRSVRSYLAHAINPCKHWASHIFLGT